MNVAIITISDTVASGERQDASGPAVAARCQELKFTVESTHTLPDDPAQIRSLLGKLADAQNIDVILTTGGTGIGPRDSTPEATQAIAERLVPGMAEEMRRNGLHIPSSDSVAWWAAIAQHAHSQFAGSPKGR
jgi:molybdenum cofactor synthesis domain-containing protein